MSDQPGIRQEDEDREVERQAASLKDQLSKDVASWSKERREQSSEPAPELVRQPVKRPSPRAAEKPKAAAKTSAAAAKPAGASSKPFSMSYDGVTAAQHIQYMLDRRTR